MCEWISVKDEPPELTNELYYIYLPSINKHTTFKGFYSKITKRWNVNDLKGYSNTKRVTHYKKITLPDKPKE